jgi:hypothetical protein
MENAYMKHFIALLITLAPLSYAQANCLVALTDSRGYTIEEFYGQSRVYENSCRQALRECNREKVKLERTSNYTRLRCERVASSGRRMPLPGTNRPTHPRRPGTHPTDLYPQVGDIVITSNMNSGTAEVLGLYPNEVIVKQSNSWFNKTVRNEEVAMTRGCLRQICVGQKVIPRDKNSGTSVVKAINFYTQTIVSLSNNSWSYDRDLDENIFLAEGCMANVCVGDRVFTRNSSFARIIKGYNPVTREVKTISVNGWSYNTEHLSDIALSH